MTASNAARLKSLGSLIRAKVADLSSFGTDGELSDDAVSSIVSAAGDASRGIGRGRSSIGAAFAETDGASLWVGYWLPEDIAAQLAIPGGELVEDLHMTFVWLGDMASLPADAVERVQAAVQSFSLSRRAFDVHVNGAARFDAESNSRGKDVIYASVDCQSVETLRLDLCLKLCEVGIPYPWGDREYTPHITLAYVDSDTEISLTLPDVTFTLDSLTVSTDKTVEARTTYPLRGPSIDMYSYPLMMAEPIRAMEPPATIPVLPIPGTYSHPVWGDIVLDEARIEHFITQFDAHIYQDKLPIDLEHETKLSGAAGYIVGLQQNENGSVDGVVEWTDRGRDALERDRFQYISPEWYDEWEDPMTSTIHSDVLIGAALTTRPFFKAAALRPIAASESTDASGDARKVRGYKVTTPAGNGTTTPPAATTSTTVSLSEEQFKRFTELEAENKRLSETLAANEATTTQAREESKALAETVSKMAAEQRRSKFTAMVTGKGGESDGVRWFGEPDKHVKMLEFLHTTAGPDSEQFSDYVTQQRALAEQMRSSTLFQETGSNASGGSTSDPQGQIGEMSRKRASEKGIGISQATREIMTEQPDLAKRAAEQARIKV